MGGVRVEGTQTAQAVSTNKHHLSTIKHLCAVPCAAAPASPPITTRCAGVSDCAPSCATSCLTTSLAVSLSAVSGMFFSTLAPVALGTCAVTMPTLPNACVARTSHKEQLLYQCRYEKGIVVVRTIAAEVGFVRPLRRHVPQPLQ